MGILFRNSSNSIDSRSLFLWFGEKTVKTEQVKEMRNIDSGLGHTTLVIRVAKHEWEEHDSNEQAAEAAWSLLCFGI